jgi:hypothetical protein
MRPNIRFILIFSAVLFIHSCQSADSSQPGKTVLRAPAYPLITVDPYTSAWSRSDNLFDDAVRHWTGTTHPLIGAIRVDGQVFRFLGKEELPLEMVIPTAMYQSWQGKYTLKQPARGWQDKLFRDSGWETGKGAFGTRDMPFLSTPWETQDIWIRREFDLKNDPDGGDLTLAYSHDDIFELYLNGKQLVKTGYVWRKDVFLPLDKALLSPDGRNVIAAHCHNVTGGGYVDFGIFRKKNLKEFFPQTAIQRSVALSATGTAYRFTCGPVDLELTFLSPLLPAKPEILSRPVNYVQYEVQSNDRKIHDVRIYLEATPQWAVDQVAQEVTVQKGTTGNLTFFKAGTTGQHILGKKGDDRRIDWGYFYLCGKTDPEMTFATGDYAGIKQQFIDRGELQDPGGHSDTYLMYRNMPVMACARNLGQVGSGSSSGYVMVGYDDLYSIQYFGDNRMAWWKEEGRVTMEDALQMADKEYVQIRRECARFDDQLWEEALRAGGKEYADLCVLAFRQSVAAHKLVKDKEGNTLFFSKENFSNGSIGTVDVTYPSAPLFLYYNPELLKGMLNPIFYFSESGKWKKPFSAHDTGTYPLANGQTYGGDMPVEECGNMLILTTAIALVEGNANFAAKHWQVLTTWADYLLQNGLDPENQLCTDDFAGHFAHNTNLSIKAIMGIAGYGKLASMLRKADLSRQYGEKAREMASKWIAMAENGDHYRLTFDQPGTWSQKYNLVWDKLLDFNLFPKEVAEKEIAFYLTKMNKYGLPLDNRRTYTKSDWIIWTATLASDTASFRKMIAPLHRFVTETPDRVPMTDWYETTDARQVGFQARSVVGGYFIKMLESKMKKKSTP